MTRIRTIESSEELNLVKKLWRASSTTLGFFPDGAFQEYMLCRWILGAFGQTHECQGYLSYRVSKSNAVIVHLCVDPQVRGKGIARALFKEMRKLTAGCRGGLKSAPVVITL